MPIKKGAKKHPIGLVMRKSRNTAHDSVQAQRPRQAGAEARFSEALEALVQWTVEEPSKSFNRFPPFPGPRRSHGQIEDEKNGCPGKAPQRAGRVKGK